MMHGSMSGMSNQLYKVIRHISVSRGIIPMVTMLVPGKPSMVASMAATFDLGDQLQEIISAVCGMKVLVYMKIIQSCHFSARLACLFLFSLWPRVAQNLYSGLFYWEALKRTVCPGFPRKIYLPEYIFLVDGFFSNTGH